MQHAYTLKPGHPTPGRPNLLRPPIALCIGTGILTRFPSTTPFGLALGADSPCADERCAGNLGLSASGPFTRFIATHVSIRTSDTSSSPLEPPSQTYRTLPYHAHAPLNPLDPHITKLDVRNALPKARFARFRQLLSSNALKGACASAASVIGLSPVTSSAQDDSTSELLRFLQRMAASKPTSWLSVPSHLVYHLANHSGP